jgi:hypothetical protein
MSASARLSASGRKRSCTGRQQAARSGLLAKNGIGPKKKFSFLKSQPTNEAPMRILKSSLAFLFSVAVSGCTTTQIAPTVAAKVDGSCSTAPGGACYAGPGGPMYAGPGGAASAGPGGPLYAGPGGAMYAGPGGPLYAGPGGACYAGPGGACDATSEAPKQCPAICKPVASAVSATN